MASYTLSINLTDLDYGEDFVDEGVTSKMYSGDEKVIIASYGMTVSARVAIWVSKNSSPNHLKVDQIAIQTKRNSSASTTLEASGSTSLSFTGLTKGSNYRASVGTHPKSPPSTSYETWYYWSISDLYINSTENSTSTSGVSFSVTISGTVTFTTGNGYTASITSTKASLKFLTHTIKYNTRQGSVWNTDKTLRGWTYIIREPREYSYNEPGSQKYTIDYNTGDGDSVSSVNKTEGYTLKKSFSEYYDNRGYSFAVNEQWRAKADIILTPYYGNSEITSYSSEAKFGNLPTVYCLGYEPTNLWYNSNNVQIMSNDLLRDSPYTTSDGVRHVAIHVVWTPRTYEIKFNLTSKGGEGTASLNEGDELPTITKTYGTPVALWQVRPILNGYTFLGWSDSRNLIAPRDPWSETGMQFGDQAYRNDCYWDRDHSNKKHVPVVWLYPCWETNPLKIKGKYFLSDSGTEQTYNTQFDITTTTEGENAYYMYSPDRLRDGDYVFLGWVDSLPDGWTDSSYINNGYHGTYTIPPEKILSTGGVEMPIELPVKFSTKNRTDWGTTATYYGVWVKTGKYLKIPTTNGGSKWVKVNKAFVKVNDNGTVKWKVVTDIWVKSKTDNQWKHEI